MARRNRPSPILDSEEFSSAPATLEATTPGHAAVPVKNGFIDFRECPEVFDAGTLTAPGKFVGRLAGMSYSRGNTAPNTPSGAGRACNPTISMVGGAVPLTLGMTRPAEVISVGPGAPPPPMHTPHLPTDMTGFPGFRSAGAPAPPMQSPHVKPRQVSLSSAIAPPAPQVLAMSNAISAQVPQAYANYGMVAMAPVMAAPAALPVVQAQPTTRQQLEAGSLIEVKSLMEDGTYSTMPRFAPPSYAIGGYNLQTPSGAGPPMYAPSCVTPAGPPMYAPSCGTPAGVTVNRFFAAGELAGAPTYAPRLSTSSIPATPSGMLAWPPTPF